MRDVLRGVRCQSSWLRWRLRSPCPIQTLSLGYRGDAYRRMAMRAAPDNEAESYLDELELVALEDAY